MTIRKSLYLISILLIATSCFVSKDNDVYAFFPNGSKLLRQTFTEASQIILDKNDVILVWDISTDRDWVNPHLLFYDSALALRSACYLPAHRIDDVRNDTLFAEIVPEKRERESSFRSTRDSRYTIMFTGEVGVGKSRGDKLVRALVINEVDNTVTFYIKKAADSLAGIRAPHILDVFTEEDSIVCRLRDLKMNYEEGEMSVVSRNAANEVIHDILLFESKKIYDEFYDTLWQIIQKRRDSVTGKQ